MSKSRFNRSPMLWLAVTFGLGIFAQSLIDIALLAGISITGVLAITGILLRSKAFATYLILLAAFFAGIVAAKVEIVDVSPDRVKFLYDGGSIPSGDPVEIEGVLLGRPEASIDGYQLTISTRKIRHRGNYLMASGNVRLFLKTSAETPLRYGSLVRVNTRLQRDDGYLNPGVMPRREILDRMRIDATGVVKSPLLIEHLADESVFLPLAWVYDQRAAVIESLRKNLSGPAAGVMIASLLGNREFLDKQTADLFRDGGTFHILVISGLHITFFGGFLLWILKKITQRSPILFGVTNIILWAYTLAVGADVPVVRAALMFTTMSFAFLIGRKSSLLNALGISVLILLTWRPSDAFNPSFQLTFVSVLAIVAIAFPFLEKLRSIGGWTPTPSQPFPPNVPKWLSGIAETLYWDRNAWVINAEREVWKANLVKRPVLGRLSTPSFQRVLRPLFEGASVSIIVIICMLPLSIIYFHRVSLGAVVLNLWVGFFIALESFAVVTAVLLGTLNEFFARGFYVLAEFFNWTMLLLPRLMPMDGWLSFRVPAYSGIGRLVYCIFIFPLIFLGAAVYHWDPFELASQKIWSTRRWVAAWAVLLAGTAAAAVFHPFVGYQHDGTLRVDFLDVGQGDSALVTFPSGKRMLVDGGGRLRYSDGDNEDEFVPDAPGVGETVVSPYLWGLGISRLDLVIATHGDADHAQGLIDVSKNFSIGALMIVKASEKTQEIADLLELAARKGIPVDDVAAGEAFTIDEVLIEVLHPAGNAAWLASTPNDNSIVLKLTYGLRSILLTGDIESAAERSLTRSSAKLTADVVKVAHHGSRTSSIPEFVSAVGAKIAVIPVGRRSPHGHPHAEVVERWKNAGANVKTTGERGTVTVRTDGNDLNVSFYLD